MKKILIFALLGLVFCTQKTIAATSSTDFTIVLVRSQYFKVFENGTIEELKDINAKEIIDQKALDDVKVGKEDIAYVADGNLWIKDSNTKRKIQISTEGKASKNIYELGVDVKLLKISKDGQKILYHVGHGRPEGFDGPNRKVMPANYGFYLYDMQKKSSKLLNISGFSDLSSRSDILDVTFIDWNSEGKLFFLKKNSIVTYDTVTRKEETVFEYKIPNASISQVLLGSNGIDLFATAVTWAGRAGPGTSRIIKINLKTKEQTILSPVGRFAEYQFPSESPNGTFLIYQHQVKQDLIEWFINNEKVFTLTGIPQLVQWINDNVAVIHVFLLSPQSMNLIVLDVKNKKKLAEETVWKR